MTLPWVPPESLRGNSRAHHMAKYHAAFRMRDDALALTKEVGHPKVGPFQKAKITFTFHHDRKIDADNLAIGMKSFVDGYLVDSGAVPDDDPDHVVYGEHRFVICAKNESRTEVLIEEVA